MKSPRYGGDIYRPRRSSRSRWRDRRRGAAGNSRRRVELRRFLCADASRQLGKVASGTDVNFPQNGPITNTNIGRLGPSSFNLAVIGTCQILFQGGVTEAGQLILTLNGQDLPETVVGRVTGTSQIVGMAIVTTTAVDSGLTVRNPAGNTAALTITPLAGGTRPVSAHLVITSSNRIQVRPLRLNDTPYTALQGRAV